MTPQRKLPVLLKLFLIFLILSHISCATTIGPGVSTQEVAQRQSELEVKARQFKAKQLDRVRLISERLISFLPPEDREKLKNIEYEVSDDMEINACVNWYKLTVNYGLLRFTESDDELATVIAHELAHLVKGHYGKKMATTVLAAAVGVVAGAAVEAATQGSGAGQPVATLVTRGLSGGFSRDYEREADYFGFQYLYLAGFDTMQGAGVWERFAIEIPKSMSKSWLSSHPSSPERLIRAEKTIAELQAQGISPNYFKGSPQIQSGVSGRNLLGGALSVPGRMVTGSISAVTAPLTQSMSLAESSTSNQSVGKSQSQQASQPAASETPSEEQKEIQTLREEVNRLKTQEAERIKKEADQTLQEAAKKEELERALLEAKEAAKELRFQEFGVEDMGLAQKVTNLWLGKKMTGRQLIFSVQQGSVDWFAQYGRWTRNSLKALSMVHRKYRAYWYMPNGKLYSEQNFSQAQTRNDFAKTTLTWDPGLGNLMVGKWLVRIFENGKLLDEQTFEVIQAN